MFRDLLDACRLWRFWGFDAWLEQVLRHRQSLLGILWLLLPTIFFVGLVGTIFSRIVDPGVNFYLYMLVGLVIWAPVNHILSTSGNCYAVNKSFFLIGSLPLLTFNFKMIAQAFIYLLIQSLLIIPAWLWFRHVPSLDLLFSFVGIGLLFLLLFPISVSIALIGARYEDFGEIMRAFQRILFLSTPIIWSASVNSERFVAIKPLLFVNPFFFAVELIRAPIVGQPINHDFWLPLLGFIMLAWIVAWVCYRLMAKDTAQWL